MSPARQPKGSPGRREIGRQASIDRSRQTTRNAAGLSRMAKKQRPFDPHIFLATIGQVEKF